LKNKYLSVILFLFTDCKQNTAMRLSDCIYPVLNVYYYNKTSNFIPMLLLFHFDASFSDLC